MKAIALASGGLDSILAIKIVSELGIDVIAVNFLTPFQTHNHLNSIKNRFRKLGIELKIINLSEDLIEILKNPKHGYGKNLNPCIDCHILMLKRAKKLMEELGASFVITGEVLGQRPMSQYHSALKIIEEESGLEGLILRPLSAKLLPESIPEKEGWVNRQNLLDISGRSRRKQINLAVKYNIENYPQPAGGCLLTDPEFTKRLKDIMQYSEINIKNIELIKIGRHFRLSPTYKLIIGRNEWENKRLLQLSTEGEIHFKPLDVIGPIAMGLGLPNSDIVNTSLRIISRYCDGSAGQKIKIAVKGYPDSNVNLNVVSKIDIDEFEEFEKFRI